MKMDFSGKMFLPCLKITSFLALAFFCFTSCNTKKELKVEPDQKLGHVVLQVSDLQESQKFYEDVLHMTTHEEAVYDNAKRIFLSSGDSHHELVLKEGLKDRIPTKKRYLQQMAIKVKGHDELVSYYEELKRRNMPLELKDNRVSWSIYIYDPDSVYVEIYWDVRDEPFGEDKLKGIQNNLTPEQLKNPPSN
ncbi:VOC family protein [Zunongwangia sp. F363]|uniref:VOC family protein n=1 Tax=Autumnicola tepida TaxID=3075595 RepID=A0ABU3C8H9_9FLAO|nr:VOC family protein [Zunongwangia sp. F363]MDT0642649.1 VOC family protein [Zunongwangia sp. F363]